jgi:ABC-type antimicrobial peptide transport system permease subunit
MALGARESDVLCLVVGYGARIALVGVAIGIVSALLLTRLLRDFLYGVSPADPVTFLAVAAILVFVGLLASYLPARRASRLDPLIALRHE